jgi:hypothetical protein
VPCSLPLGVIRNFHALARTTKHETYIFTRYLIKPVKKSASPQNCTELKADFSSKIDLVFRLICLRLPFVLSRCLFNPLNPLWGGSFYR